MERRGEEGFPFFSPEDGGLKKLKLQRVLGGGLTWAIVSPEIRLAIQRNYMTNKIECYFGYVQKRSTIRNRWNSFQIGEFGV